MSTLPNIRKPDELSAEMGRHAKSASVSKIAICRLFAEAWESYKNGGWSNSEFRDFSIAIFKLGIGPDPVGNLLVLDDQAKYKLVSTWDYMNTAGSHPMYQDADILEVCRLSSITKLYELTTLWKAASRRKNSKSDDLALAKSRVLKFLTQFPNPTREQIAAARDDLRAAAKNDPAPPKDNSKVPISGATTIADLIERGDQFDSILLTPSDEVWEEIANTPVSNLDEKFGYYELRKPQTSINIVAKGNRATAALKMAEVLGVPNPSVFCILDQNVKDRVLSLDKVTLLVSSNALAAPKKVDKKIGASEIARNMVKSEGNNLHLFADTETDGWATVTQGS
jgi:hypothetical protein